MIERKFSDRSALEKARFETVHIGVGVHSIITTFCYLFLRSGYRSTGLSQVYASDEFNEDTQHRLAMDDALGKAAEYLR